MIKDIGSKAEITVPAARSSTVGIHIMKREIPYEKIRAIESERRWYTYSMLSLKCALDHLNVRYNSFDVITVSVKGNAELESALLARISAAKNKRDA